MASVSTITVLYRVVLLTDAIALVEFTWPGGAVTLVGVLLEPREPWQDGSGGWEGEDGG